MEKLLNLLGAKSEDEAISVVGALAAPPVIVTVVYTAVNGISVSAVGKPPKDLVEKALTEALKLVLKMIEDKKEAPV